MPFQHGSEEQSQITTLTLPEANGWPGSSGTEFQSALQQLNALLQQRMQHLEQVHSRELAKISARSSQVTEEKVSEADAIRADVIDDNSSKGKTEDCIVVLAEDGLQAPSK